VDSNTRLRIATRIHFALLRSYGEDIGVTSLLAGEGDAREALWVCEASGNDELVTLAKKFNASARAAARAGLDAPVAAPAATSATPTRTRPTTLAATPQEMPWSRETSGFGLSRLSEFGASTLEGKPTNWLSPSGWLRRGNGR